MVNKKSILYVISSLLMFMVLFFLAVFSSKKGIDSVGYNATTYKKYFPTDFVFFDPITHKTCNSKNYWTPVNQNTSCYRFVVITANDTVSRPNIKIMLDHNINTSTFDNLNNSLTSATKSWSGYNKTVGIKVISENDIKTLNEPKNQRDFSPYSVVFNKPTINVEGKTKYSYDGDTSGNVGVEFSTLSANSYYYIKDKSYKSNGSWTSTGYNKSYAYALTTSGLNKVVLKTTKLGVRPVIEVSKKSLTNVPTYDITNLLQKGVVYKYGPIWSHKQKFDNMQGFVFLEKTSDAPARLAFYSNYSGDESGILIVCPYNTSNNINNCNIQYSTTTAHGNDMTYDSKTKQLLLTGPKNSNNVRYGSIYLYDHKKSGVVWSKKIEPKVRYTAIAFDSINNYYFATGTPQGGKRVYLLDKNFNLHTSFDTPYEGTDQAMGFYNGYVFVVDYEAGGCPSSFQMICEEQANSTAAKVHVYNAKINSDGSPTNTFGREILQFQIKRRVGNMYNTKMELETVSFGDGKMFFAFNSNGDSSYPFKIISVSLSDVVKYINDNTLKASVQFNGSKLMINTSEQVKSVSGWTLATDKKQIYKTLSKTSAATTQKVCNHYNECVSASIPKTYIVSYDPIGGKVATKSFIVAQNTSMISSVYGTLLTPTKSGYSFDGWYLEKTYKTKVSSTSKVKLNKNHILYAKWSKKDFSIEDVSNYKKLGNYAELGSNLDVSGIKLKGNYKAKLKNSKKGYKTSGKVGTGDILEVYDQSTKVLEMSVVVRGDLNSDGIVNVADVSKLYQYLKKKITMDNIYIQAGNVVSPNSNVIDIGDVSKLYQFVKGKIKSLV